MDLWVVYVFYTRIFRICDRWIYGLYMYFIQGFLGFVIDGLYMYFIQGFLGFVILLGVVGSWFN